MDFQQNELKRILPQKGWAIDILDNYDFQGWARDVWHVRSVWSPVGASAYIAFLLDPMDIRSERASTWAISVYAEPPLSGVEDVFCLSLSHWKKQLPQFLQSLEALRVQTNG